ncbi:DUF3011 domain-containing protein [Dokdonella sp.]|uniref:DUF3011 domain-containing protein n=1 Tax=Dokdonella sp. TaxID=2291710 RepID=UPI003784DAD5
MLKPVHGIIALTLSVCAVSAAAAPDALPLASALRATAAAQYNNDWQPGPGWDRDIDVRCASEGYQYNMCQVDTGRGSDVRLVSQISKTRCVEGSSWGWNRAGIWVDQGCEGVFRVQRRWKGGEGGRHGGHHAGGGGYAGGDGDWRPGPDWDRAIRVRCASNGFEYNMCQVDTGRGSDVTIAKQISKTRCMEGRNWGWNRAGIWVDQGCEAEFVVQRRWR